MIEFECKCKVGAYQVGYYFEIGKGNKVVKGYVVRSQNRKVLKFGFKSLEAALYWAEEEIELEELRGELTKLADNIESSLEELNLAIETKAKPQTSPKNSI